MASFRSDRHRVVGVGRRALWGVTLACLGFLGGFVAAYLAARLTWHGRNMPADWPLRSGMMGSLLGTLLGSAGGSVAGHLNDLRTSRRITLAWSSAIERSETNLLAFAVECAYAMTTYAGSLQPAQLARLREMLTERFEIGRASLDAIEARMRADRRTTLSARFLGQRLAQMSDPRRFLRFLYEIAAADGCVDEKERRFIDQLVLSANIAEEVHAEVRREYIDDLERFWQVLELPRGSSSDDVRSAYRRLALDYHPDRVQRLPRGYQEFAEERMKELNAAYAALREGGEPN